MNVGVTAEGQVFIGEVEALAPRVNMDQDLRLDLQTRASGSAYAVRLRADDSMGRRLGKITRQVPAEWLEGGVELVCSSGRVEPTPQPLGKLTGYEFCPSNQEWRGSMLFWFADWTLGETKIDMYEERAYGPILFALYAVSRGVFKISGQLLPLGDAPGQVRLQVRNHGSRWKTIATAELDPDVWNAIFRMPSWDDTQERPNRLLYAMPDASGKLRQHVYEGTIRRNPKNKNEITVGLLTCIWDMGFPYSDFVHNLVWHTPDVLLWTGDQVYERVGGFGVGETLEPELLVPSMLDYLRKWCVFGWATRDLTREIPSACMVDDHDMFHGNIWGCGGKPTDSGLPLDSTAAQDSGGYKMPARWGNMAQRAQASHLPDPFNPTPVPWGITVYYTDLPWGGISFAILEDRKWKLVPTVECPEAKIVDGFPEDPRWDAPKGDVSSAELLGQRQLNFPEYWAADWTDGAWMKFAVSQTRLACLQSTPTGDPNDNPDPQLPILPVGEYPPNSWTLADRNTDGWPKHKRNDAIRKWRKVFALHLSGDQHEGATWRYGVDEFRDGAYEICTPAISNLWPRRWFSAHPGKNVLPGRRNTGDYFDRFGNRITVLAVANPDHYSGAGLEGLWNRATGYSILRCNCQTREVQVAVWPRWVDPSLPGAKPYQDWPITVKQLDNGLHGAQWVLEKIETAGQRDPVIQVQNESDGEMVYTIRISGDSFTPLVREPGAYTVVAFNPNGGSGWRGKE